MFKTDSFSNLLLINFSIFLFDRFISDDPVSIIILPNLPSTILIIIIPSLMFCSGK